MIKFLKGEKVYKGIFNEKWYLNFYPGEKDNLRQLLELVNDNINDSTNLFNRKNFQGHITASGFIYCI